MSNECKGCLSFRSHRSLGNQCGDEAILHLSETEQCPCSICLVKVLCTNGCKEFQEYKRLYRRRVDNNE